MGTTKEVASPSNFNTAKIEMDEQRKEEKSLRKLLNKEKDRKSHSPDRKTSMEKIKKTDAVDTRDLRTQFREKVK